MNASELQNQAKANQIQKVTLVAPYYQKKWEQALKAEDDTLMLKWIESGLGSEQYKQLFETFEDLSIKMGPRKKIRLFEDMRNYEDDAPVFKKARSRPGSNYANWKEQRNRLISPPPSNNVKLKLEYLSK